MTSRPTIICFKHCLSESIFCNKVPSICPLCKKSIVTFKLEPFEIPYPFINAKQNPTSIILRPSYGDFLHNFNINQDLHIGVVNSNGEIFEFDKRGLVKNDFSKWTNCISLKLIPKSWELHWDETLEIITKNSKWKTNNYHELTFNCFNFIIEFLELLKFENIQFMNKEEMCENLILPKLQEAMRFISLYRKLLTNNYIVQN
ncbi:MKRN2 opposite strand protein [Leptopilina boulardi]|uniref:MKRN2 opposite strand protein n=1 Tax=Leptopilina boulardi TaxID=63433 RepID=UPI0021F5448B|nr:MKRN2 opposite strand protein [Leptopilina boulardi]